MIEVIDFYTKGAHVAQVKHEFNPSTFGSDAVVHEVGFLPNEDSRKSKKASAYRLTVDNADLLILNKGHVYDVKLKDAGATLVVNASDQHEIVHLDSDIKSIKSGDDYVDVLS